MTTVLAFIALGVAAAGWFAVRWMEESERIDRTIAEVLMSIDLRDESEVET